MSRRVGARKLSDVISEIMTPTTLSPHRPESQAESADNEENENEDSDESNLPPFDLAAALQSVQSVSSSVTKAPAPQQSSRKRRGKDNGGRWPKKPPIVTETTYCFALRGPNSLFKVDKSAMFTIGGVYELKCAVLTPPRTNYACRTVLTLHCDDADKWAEIEARLDSGFLLNDQPAPKHVITMDRPSPRTHRNVKAGKHSLEFTWDASGTIFVYLRFMAALADLCSDPIPLRLYVQSTFLEAPYDPNTRSLIIETVGHPSLIDTSQGSSGVIDIANVGLEGPVPEDDTKELLYEAPTPTDIDDTDFVRSVINSVAKAANNGRNDSSPMAVIERAIQESLSNPDETPGGRFQVRVDAATLGEALGSFLNNSASSMSNGNGKPQPAPPRPRGRPRKFHYPEYCYSKTALQKNMGPNPTEWRGPAAEMQAIQRMQQRSAQNQEAKPMVPEKRIKMDIVNEQPINMMSLIHAVSSGFDESDKPSSSIEDVDPNPEVKKFLISKRMGNFVPIFAKYTMSEMRSLSSEDCRLICANDAEGVRLYQALRQRSHTSTNRKLRIFVAPKVDDEEEPCYELLNLTPPTVSELHHSLHTKTILNSETSKICVAGPNGINVQLSDEILEQWEDNSVFQYSVHNNTLKLVQINIQS